MEIRSQNQKCSILAREVRSFCIISASDGIDYETKKTGTYTYIIRQINFLVYKLRTRVSPSYEQKSSRKMCRRRVKEKLEESSGKEIKNQQVKGRRPKRKF